MIRVAAIAIAALAFAAPAHATYCLPLDEMLSEYRAEFGETATWGGVSGKDHGNGIMILTAPDGSWTLLFTDGDTACMADYGHEARLFPKANV